MGNIFDSVILGSGPAGLTAGIYMARAGRKALIVGGTKWGGQLMLTTLVENYPGFVNGIQGPELMMNMRKQTERLGVEVLNTEFTQVDFSRFPFETTINSEIIQSKSIIIATGADSIWLNVPGELQLRGKGISTCATCDAFFFRDKDVVVVGGGDSAMEESLVLAKVAKSVTIIHRRDKFKAAFLMQEKVKGNKKIIVLWNKEITRYLGDNHLESVFLKDTTSGKESQFKTDGVFLAIGHKPNSNRFKGIDLDSKGYVVRKVIKGDNGLFKYSTATNQPGVFVSGDIHDYLYRQAITAAAFGCMAALDSDRWLSENEEDLKA